MQSGHTDGQAKAINPQAKQKGSVRYFVWTSLSDRDPWQCDDNSKKKKKNCGEEVRRPDVSVNRLNCSATSPDYFLALIFCLPSATDLNESIHGVCSTKYATKFCRYLLSWRPININGLLLERLRGFWRPALPKNCFRGNFPGSSLMWRGAPRGQIRTCWIHMGVVMVH